MLLLFAPLLRRMTKMIGRSTSSEETQPLPDDDDDKIEAWVVRHSGERAILRSSEVPNWLRPKQVPISAETVFLSHFQKDPQAFYHKTRGSMTIDDAWERLSRRKRQRYVAKAKENELHNTAKIAELNKRRPLSPSR